MIIVFAVTLPAFAQPFSDGTGPAWMSNALAKLAADGILQGYPDGTFRGDRAVTRYEMAVMVARILARIESQQQTSPQTGPRPTVAAPPQISKADLDLILRLTEDLRQELADLNVRVPAAEADLRAIEARLDNVRITGLMRFREDLARTTAGQGASINGNPLTSATDAAAAPVTNRAAYLFKLVFDGFVTDHLHFIAGLMTQGDTFQTFNSGEIGAASPAFTGSANGSFSSIDSAFLDWTQTWGTRPNIDTPIPTLEVWLGRFGADPQPGPCSTGCYPITFGPFGLLMNDTGATWADSTSDSGVNVADGLRVALHLPNFADLQAQAVLLRVAGGTGDPLAPPSGIPYSFGEDAYGVDANIQANYWTRVGAYYVGNNIVPIDTAPGPGGFGNAAQWHLYGPGGGAMNSGNTGTLTAGAYHCAAASGGITCPAAGSGWGAYVDSDILHGVHLDGEYAQWNDAVFATSDTGYQVNLTFDLGELTKVHHNWSLQAGFLRYGQNFYPPYGAAEADAVENDTIYPGNAQGVTVQMSFAPIEKWTTYGIVFDGSNLSNGQALVEYEVGVQYAFATNAQLWFLVRELRIAGVEQFLLYRAQVDYTF